MDCQIWKNGGESMMSKILVSLVLVMCLLILAIPATASDNVGLVKDSTQGIIINQETVLVDGIPVTFTLYDNDGVYSETVHIDENVDINFKGRQERDMFLNAVLAIADQRAVDLVHPLLSQDDQFLRDEPILPQSYYSWTESKNFAAAGTGGGENPNTYAGHWSMVDYTIYETFGEMRAYDGASRVYYAGTLRPIAAMQVTETITRSSWQISVSYPLGFSVTPSQTSATLTSYWHQPGTAICTQWRNNFRADSIINTGTFVRVNTTVQAYIGGNAYVAAVESRW